MFKAIFFDFDGVLTLDQTGSLTTTRHISKVTGIDPRRVEAAFALFNDDLTRGKCTHAAVWADIRRALGADVDISCLRRRLLAPP